MFCVHCSAPCVAILCRVSCLVLRFMKISYNRVPHAASLCASQGADTTGCGLCSTDLHGPVAPPDPETLAAGPAERCAGAPDEVPRRGGQWPLMCCPFSSGDLLLSSPRRSAAAMHSLTIMPEPEPVAAAAGDGISFSGLRSDDAGLLECSTRKVFLSSES